MPEAPKYPKTRIGLFSIGLDAYWPQFSGLKEKLLGYNRQIAGRLGRDGVEVVNLELVDTPEKAMAAGHRFRETPVTAENIRKVLS